MPDLDQAGALGWEDDDTVLHGAYHGEKTIVVRCLVASGDCVVAATLTRIGGVPAPLPIYGARP